MGFSRMLEGIHLIPPLRFAPSHILGGESSQIPNLPTDFGSGPWIFCGCGANGRCAESFPCRSQLSHAVPLWEAADSSTLERGQCNLIRVTGNRQQLQRAATSAGFHFTEGRVSSIFMCGPRSCFVSPLPCY